MGTRGYRIIRFRGRNWIFYNHWDSYPKGMGKSLVNLIPADPEEYRLWLQAQREFYAEWDDLLQDFLNIKPEDFAKLTSRETDTSSGDDRLWHEAFDERLQSFPPTHVSGDNDLFIEWTYTIDLDQEVFSVDIEPISDLAKFQGAIIAGESATSLAVNSEDFASDASQYLKTLKWRTVTPKFTVVKVSQPASVRIRWLCFNIFQSTQRSSLTKSLLSWTADDMPFREISYFILCLAAGGDNLALVDTRRILEKDGYAGILTGFDHGADMEFASSLASGYHKQGLPSGSAPVEAMYWFEGALVSLVPRLNRPGILEKAIGNVIEYGRDQCGRRSFHAVLLSIEHLVLLKSYSNGELDHTELLPLISIQTHRSLDAIERYGKEVVDKLYKATLRKDEDITEKGDASGVDLVETSTRKEEVNSDEEEELNEHETTASEIFETWAPHETFLSLIAFFEASICEGLKPTNREGYKISNEIYEKILSHVSDMRTYNACLRVSRGIRSLCQQRPLVMDDVRLSEVQSQENSDKRNLRAVVLSTGEQQDVSFSRNSEFNSTTYQIFVCSQRDRKTFVDDDTKISLLNIQVPLQSSHHYVVVDHTRSSRARRPTSSLQDPEPTDPRWKRLFNRSCVKELISSIEMQELWERLLRSFDIKCSHATIQDWELPPNTKQMLANHEDYDLEAAGSFQYLSLRLKRPNRFANDLWDKITHETAQYLERPDEGIFFVECEPPQTIGTNDPYVLLAVGTEVRLCRWTQSSDDHVAKNRTKSGAGSTNLQDLHQGKTFSILEETGRQIIVEFLEEVKDHRDTQIATRKKKPEPEVIESANETACSD